MADQPVVSTPPALRTSWWRFFFFFFLVLFLVIVCSLCAQIWSMQQRLHGQEQRMLQVSAQSLAQSQQLTRIFDQLATVQTAVSHTVHTGDATRLYVRNLALSVIQDIVLASDCLVLQKDVPHALFFLKQADVILQGTALPVLFHPLAVAIHTDINRLMPLMGVDLTAIHANLRSLLFLIDRLPDVFHQPLEGSIKGSEVSSTGDHWSLGWLHAQFSALFVVRRFSPLDVLSPNEIFYLRRYLRVLLLNAYFELQAGDISGFRRDIQAFHFGLLHYYGSTSMPEMLDLTEKVLHMPVPNAWPDLMSEKQMAFDILHHFLQS